MSTTSVKLFEDISDNEKEKHIINSIILDDMFFSNNTYSNMDFSSGDVSDEYKKSKETSILKKLKKGISEGYLSEKLLIKSINEVIFPATVFLNLKIFLNNKSLLSNNYECLITNDSLIISGIELYPDKIWKKIKEKTLLKKIIFKLNGKDIDLLYENDEKEKSLTKVSIISDKWKDELSLKTCEILDQIIIKNKDLLIIYFEETAKKIIKKIKKSEKFDGEISFKILNDFNYKTVNSDKIPVMLLIGDECLDISDIEEPVKISNYNSKVKSWIEKQKIKENLLEDVENINLKKRI